MSGPTHQQNAKLDFLFNASYSLLGTAPSLSSFYMKQFQTSLKAFELKNHATLQKTSCTKCGTIKLPGVNHKVEIKTVKKKKQEKLAKDNDNKKKVVKKVRRKNQLVEHCLACSHIKIYHGSQKKKLPKDIADNNVNKLQLEQKQPQKQQQQQQNQLQQNKKQQPYQQQQQQQKQQQQQQMIPEKKKKAKSKKNNLQALLSKQQEQKEQSKSSLGGNLNDFLSSL